MHKSHDRCSVCGGPLETPFEASRGHHTDCETKADGEYTEK